MELKLLFTPGTQKYVVRGKDIFMSAWGQREDYGDSWKGWAFTRYEDAVAMKEIIQLTRYFKYLNIVSLDEILVEKKYPNKPGLFSVYDGDSCVVEVPEYGRYVSFGEFMIRVTKI